MSDFSRPEYASYVALCRELELERQFREGDWFGRLFAAGDMAPFLFSDETWGYADRPARVPNRHGDTFWLPSLSDWMEMLSASGHDDVRIWKRSLGGYVAVGYQGPIASVEGPTREEACARLWIEVRNG